MADTGYSRDSERILLALSGQAELQTRELAEEADLGSTQAVHYRYKNYLGPEAYGLVEKEPPEPGGQAVWRLTESGEKWVDVNYEDIKIPQTEDEAAEVAATALEKAKSALSTAGTTAGEFQSLEERVAEAVGEAKEAASEARTELSDVEPRAREVARDEANKQVSDIEDRVSNIDELVSGNAELLLEIKKGKAGIKLVRSLEEDIDELDGRVTAMDYIVSGMDGKTERHEQTISELERGVGVLMTGEQHHTQRIDELEERVDELEGALNEVKEKAEAGVFENLLSSE